MPRPTPEEIRFAALAVDVVCFRVSGTELQCLVGKVVSENNVFSGRWAHVGGLVRVTETAEEAATRLMRDKAGLRGVFCEQLATFSKIDRDPRGRVVSVAYLGLVRGGEGVSAGIETRWEPAEKVKRLAYDHDEILATALARVRAKASYTNILRHLLPADFTLSELQRVYETVLGRELDKRNFRKKIVATGLVEATGEKRREGVMRPAALFRFVRADQQVIPAI
jgi:8-oxo-dGTP diphosphatase